MTLDRDRLIVAQNSATVAAALLSNLDDENWEDSDHLLAAFEDVRTRIFLGTLDLGETPGLPEDVATQFPGSTFVQPTVVPQFVPPVVPPQPWQPPTPPTAPPMPPMPASPPPAPVAGPGISQSCPDCGGPMWDNRSTKKGNQPDFKCKDRSCNKAVWLERRRG